MILCHADEKFVVDFRLKSEFQSSDCLQQMTIMLGYYYGSSFQIAPGCYIRK